MVSSTSGSGSQLYGVPEVGVRLYSLRSTSENDSAKTAASNEEEDSKSKKWNLKTAVRVPAIGRLLQGGC